MGELDMRDVCAGLVYRVARPADSYFCPSGSGAGRVCNCKLPAHLDCHAPVLLAALLWLDRRSVNTRSACLAAMPSALTSQLAVILCLTGGLRLSGCSRISEAAQGDFQLV